jgi:hypothetical protein
MRSFRVLLVAVLVVMLALSSGLSVEANGPTFNISLTPSCGPAGTLVTFTSPGSPTGISEQPSEFTTTITCPVEGPCFFTVLDVPVGEYTLYWYMQDGSTGIGNFHVGRCPVSKAYELCLIQLGVQQSNETVSWLPGYAYAPIPPPCPEKFDNYTDVLGRTIVIHQFNETGVYTYYPP